MGSETISFEQELALSIGALSVVTVNSCTAAMSLCLRVLGIGPGDEVICPSMTWCSTANAALYVGATPVFCDIDPASFCATPETIARHVTERTRAVMVVHFGGRAVDVAELRGKLPKRISIIEDAAHAFGARYPNGRPVGSSGNMVCFSFYANKNLSTGEGGAVALSDSTYADRLRSLRQHALPIDAWKRFTHPQAVLLSQQLTELGYKANYTDLQAAIGRVQLQRQGEFSIIRRQAAQRYLKRLADFGERLMVQAGLEHPSHALHLFPVRVTRSASLSRDELLFALRQKNIGATIHYAPLHLMPLYHASPQKTLVESEKLAQEILTLPISASVTSADIDYICDHLGALLL